MDPIENNVDFHSIIAEVGSLASYSALYNLSPYISECYKYIENITFQISIMKIKEISIYHHFQGVKKIY